MASDLFVTGFLRQKKKFLEKSYSLYTKIGVHHQTAAQQSVHPTLGILARFQAFFYASAFSQSDGVPPPAPARVTQTVGQSLS
jgi:hypothetical protein